MREEKRKTTLGALFLLWLLMIGGSYFLLPDRELSYAERRKLTENPMVTWHGIWNGTFGEEREKYLADQMPLREAFREGKALFEYRFLRKKDVHGIFVYGNQATELIPQIDEAAVDKAAQSVSKVWEKQLAGTNCRVYSAIIPDKGIYLAECTNVPSIDYTSMQECFYAHLGEYADQMTKLSLWEYLGKEDYYSTDLHWKQEKLEYIASKLAKELQVAYYRADGLEWKELGAFYGVYSGQAALPFTPDKLVYGTNEEIESCSVYHPMTGNITGVYDLDKAGDLDMYDIFLSGSEPLLVISNPNVCNGKRLVLFRDSFGSSIAPYLLKGYEEITLVDLRYIHPDALPSYLTFTDQDVLFLYYTGLLQKGYLMKS